MVQVSGRSASLAYFRLADTTGSIAGAARTPASTGSKVPSGDVLQLSPEALAASAAAAATPRTPAKNARAALDAQYAEARANGTKAVTDTSDGGRFLDLSTLDDEEVASIVNDRNKAFSSDESNFAAGILAQRMKVALSPFQGSALAGDGRGEQMAVQRLYSGVSDGVRQALGWTPDMLAMSKKVLRELDSQLGGFSQKTFLEQFGDGQSSRGALRIDMSSLAPPTRWISGIA